MKATVHRVNDVIPRRERDLVMIGALPVIARKGRYIVGDWVVHIEHGATVPEDVAQEIINVTPEGKVVSNGALYPTVEVDGFYYVQRERYARSVVIGSDVSEYLGIE